MTPFTFYHPATGEISHAMSVSIPTDSSDAWESLFDAHEADGLAWLPGAYEPDEWWIDGSDPAARPVMGLSPQHEVAAGEPWTIADVPPGTHVLVDGIEIGVTDDTGLTLVRSAPGDFRVELRPPFPWRPATATVSVSL